jgi:hypothetical protein
VRSVRISGRTAWFETSADAEFAGDLLVALGVRNITVGKLSASNIVQIQSDAEDEDQILRVVLQEWFEVA